MIPLDLDKTIYYNFGVNILSIIVVLILIISCKMWFSRAYDNVLLCRIGVWMIAILLLDTWSWQIDGENGNLVRILIYLDNMLYLIFQLVVALEWLKYAHYRIFGQHMDKKKELYAVVVPFIVMAALVITAPINGWCFYVDDVNAYHRGILSAPLAIIALGYIISASINCFKQYKKEDALDRNRELIVIAGFPILPFVGGLAQTFLYGCSILWPCGVLSLLLIYINRQNQAVSRDSLTGINNRLYLERYLRSYSNSEKDSPVMMIMIDINDFKMINDMLGHDIGDDALIKCAQIIKDTFKHTSAFLSRYGGDEFVIVLPIDNEDQGKEMIKILRDNFNEFNEKSEYPYLLSPSIGSAVVDKLAENQIKSLFKSADESMYIEKQAYHNSKV